MSRRSEKKDRFSYHDSRRYLKKHPPRRSDPLFGLQPYSEWIGPVRWAIKEYPKLARQREADLRAGGLGGTRKGPSAESVVIHHSSGPVVAVDEALERLTHAQRKRIREICFEGAEREKSDRALIGLFQRYVATYLGYGRKRYDHKSF